MDHDHVYAKRPPILIDDAGQPVYKIRGLKCNAECEMYPSLNATTREEQARRFVKCSLDFRQLIGCETRASLLRYAEENDGTMLTFPWPAGKYLHVMKPAATKKHMREDAAISALLGPGGWIVPIGFVVSERLTAHSEHNPPVLCVDMLGRVMLYVKTPPVWTTESGRVVTNDEAPRDFFYPVSDNIAVLAERGLAHCAWAYSSDGGAPYVVFPDRALECITQAGCWLERVLMAKSLWRGHTWVVRCSSGAHYNALRLEGNRVSLGLHDARSGSQLTFWVFGYVLNNPWDDLSKCNIYVLLTDRCEVFFHTVEPPCTRFAAQDPDSLFRIGLKRLYYPIPASVPP